MIEEVDVEVHRIDDWEAVYLNGELECQSHNEQLAEWLRTVKGSILLKKIRFYYHDWDTDVAYEIRKTGQFPVSLDELKSYGTY